MAEIPYRFVTDSRVEELIANHDDLEPGQETEHAVAIAGRLMLRRVQGKLAFATLDDGSGRIQLFARANSDPEFVRYCDLNVGG